MYATPMIRSVPMTTQASSCCTITLYSESLNTYFTVQNPGCGPVINQFPTCGPVSSPLADGIARVETPAALKAVGGIPPVDAAGPLKAVGGATETIRQALPVDLCVVSVNGGVNGMSVAATISGV